MNKDDKLFYTYLVTLLICLGLANEVWKSIELYRFHEANNLQIEYNKSTETKLLELTNILEMAVDPE